jgi:hypothetical protein
MRKQLREMRRLRLRTGCIDILAAERNYAATVGDLEMALLAHSALWHDIRLAL